MNKVENNTVLDGVGQLNRPIVWNGNEQMGARVTTDAVHCALSHQQQ